MCDDTPHGITTGLRIPAYLALQSHVVTIFTKNSNIRNFYVLLTQFTYALYRSQNKQQTFPCTALTALQPRRNVIWRFFDLRHGTDLFHLPTLMHNSLFINNTCYTTILDMFRALTCASSGGQIVLSQHLVSSLSVKGCTLYRIKTNNSRIWVTATGLKHKNCKFCGRF